MATDNKSGVMLHAPSENNTAAPAAGNETSALQNTLRSLLRTPCWCQACEPFYTLRALPSDPAFIDLPVSGREVFEREAERNRRALEASADASRHLPRVMDMPQDIDVADLRVRLAHDGFHPSCPQYREAVALLADGSFESAVAQSRIGHFDRAEAARCAPRKRSKKPSKPRLVKPVSSLFTPADLVIPAEHFAADQAFRKRMAQPDRLAEAHEAAQQRVAEQIAAAMLGADAEEADASDRSGR